MKGEGQVEGLQLRNAIDLFSIAPVGLCEKGGRGEWGGVSVYVYMLAILVSIESDGKDGEIPPLPIYLYFGLGRVCVWQLPYLYD